MFETAALAARGAWGLWHSGAAGGSLFQGDARRVSQEAGGSGTPWSLLFSSPSNPDLMNG